jgi:hypothetical protein
MLKIHEYISKSGELSAVLLRRVSQTLVLVDDGSELVLPAGALRAVMLRYGAPFDPNAACQRQGQLELDGGATLEHLRHLAGYDVIARDYLLYAEPDLDPVCAMATNVAGALRHLGLAARRDG